MLKELGVLSWSIIIFIGIESFKLHDKQLESIWDQSPEQHETLENVIVDDKDGDG